jgi:hypothetical protein
MSHITKLDILVFQTTLNNTTLSFYEDNMDHLTEEIVKKKINDGNGENGYLFWQLFIRLDDLKFDQEKYQKEFDIKIESLMKIICPIHEENVNRKKVKASVKKFRISFSSWITFIILVINFYLLVKGGI